MHGTICAMTLDEEKDRIARYQEIHTNSVPASAAYAKEAFMNGKILFDVTHDAKRLKQFFAGNRELEQDAMKLPDGSWGYTHLDAVDTHQVFVTATKYKQMAIQELRDAGLISG